MELLCVLPPLAALWLLCAFLTLRAGLAPALAPLPALALLVTALMVFGVAGALVPGMWLLLFLCAAAGAWALVPRKSCRPDWRRIFAPGAVLFWAGALAFAVYFAVRRPLATGFDELNLWMTAVKVTVTDGALYSTADLGVPWAVTQNPGLPLLGYFFAFFGAFADWKVYFAYDVLLLAVDAAVVGALPWRRWRLWVPLAAVLWCVPWFFTTANRTIFLSTVYMNAYGDLPAGMVMGGAVALWLALRAGGARGTAWAVLPVLALAANLKANTFVLALAAAGLVALDALLLSDLGDGYAPFAKGLGRRAGFAAGCFAAPLAVYFLWNVNYVGRLTAQSAAAGGMGETSLPLAAVAVYGIRLLLGGSVPDEYAALEPQFRQAMADMGRQFRAGSLSMIGPGCAVTALIVGMFAAACLLAGRGWRRPAVLGLGSLGCFGGYMLMLALSYGFIFKPFQAAALTDYDRYSASWYIGWFLIALACLAQAAAAGARPRRALAGQALVLALAAGMLLRWHQLVLPQFSVLGFSDYEFAARHAEQAQAAAVGSALTAADRVFFVSQGDDGQHWFAAVSDLYPHAVDYSGSVEQGGGGGTFGLPALEPEEEGTQKYYYHPYTAAEFDAAVRDSGCTVLYLQTLDDIFVQSYAQLFTDGLAAAQSGETPLYRVTDAGFAPEPLPDPLPAGAAATAALREVAP